MDHGPPTIIEVPDPREAKFDEVEKATPDMEQWERESRAYNLESESEPEDDDIPEDELEDELEELEERRVGVPNTPVEHGYSGLPNHGEGKKNPGRLDHMSNKRGGLTSRPIRRTP